MSLTYWNEILSLLPLPSPVLSLSLSNCSSMMMPA